MPAMSAYCNNFLWRDTTAIMNLYPPLRLHPMTRGAINNIVMKHKKNLLSTPQTRTASASNDAEVEGLSKENPMLQAQLESEA